MSSDTTVMSAVKIPPTQHKCSHHLTPARALPTQQTQDPPHNKVPEIHSALACLYITACLFYLTQSSSPYLWKQIKMPMPTCSPTFTRKGSGCLFPVCINPRGTQTMSCFLASCPCSCHTILT